MVCHEPSMLQTWYAQNRLAPVCWLGGACGQAGGRDKKDAGALYDHFILATVCYASEYKGFIVLKRRPKAGPVPLVGKCSNIPAMLFQNSL